MGPSKQFFASSKIKKYSRGIYSYQTFLKLDRHSTGRDMFLIPDFQQENDRKYGTILILSYGMYYFAVLSYVKGRFSFH